MFNNNCVNNSLRILRAKISILLRCVRIQTFKRTNSRIRFPLYNSILSRFGDIFLTNVAKNNRRYRWLARRCDRARNIAPFIAPLPISEICRVIGRISGRMFCDVQFRRKLGVLEFVVYPTKVCDARDKLSSSSPLVAGARYKS